MSTAGTHTETRRAELVLHEIESLPTLPGVAARLMKIGSAEDADLKEIMRLIESDPTLRKNTLDKVRSIRMTVSMADGSVKDIVNYLREISGLNMVLEGTNEQREAKLNLELQDVTMDALLDHFTNGRLLKTAFSLAAPPK